MRVCIFEDRDVEGLHPLTLTRPASDLLCGLTTLGEKQARYFGATAIGYLCRPALAEVLRSREPRMPVNDTAWLRAAPTVLVNSRWLPPQLNECLNAPCVGTAQGEIAFAVLDTKRLETIAPAAIGDSLRECTESLPAREVGGTLIARPWELINRNGDELTRDFHATYVGAHHAGIALVGPAERLFVHPTARIDPHVVADTTGGPVVVGEGAVVTAFTRLEGPCAIGAYTRLHAAQVRAGTTIGPHCRIGGEVECSIVLGYTNKYHDGFLGHSYVGEWVNLAAGTSTGDLRCDYGPISVPFDGAEVATGLTKMGSIIGDHAKTGLGVLLNCGTALSAFSLLMPTGTLAPRAVPSFCRAGPDGMKELDVTRLLATAAVVMQRRGRELTPQLESLYRSLAPVETNMLALRKCA